MLSESTKSARPKTNVLALAYAAFVILGLPISLIGVAWPTMRVEFTQPLDAIGIMFITVTIGYATSSFFIARLISRFGIGALLVFSAMAAAATFLGYAAAPSWVWIVGLALLSGFGLGTMDAGLNTYLAAEYKESEMQWLHAFFGVGATISPLIMTASLALFDSWRPAYILVGALMLLLGVIFIATLNAWKRPKKQAEVSETHEIERGLMDYQTSIWKTLLRVGTLVSIVLFLLYCGAEYTLGNWTYTLFTEGRGVNPELAGLWTGGFWATFTLGRILAGVYSHRLRLNTLMIAGMAISALGAVLIWWNPLTWVSLVGLALAGFGQAPLFPGLISGTRQRVGARHAANAIGIQMSAANIGGAVVPALAGVLARQISLESIPVILVVCLVGLLGFYLLSMGKKDGRPKDQPPSDEQPDRIVVIPSK
jgi:fucose permease